MSLISRFFIPLLAVTPVLFLGCDNPPLTLSLSSIMPANGPAFGGTLVTLTGDHFEQGMTVQIGGLNCGSVTIVSETTATCITAPHVPATLDVVARSEDQVDSDLLRAAFTYECTDTNPAGIAIWANDGLDKVTQDDLRYRCASNAVINSVWDGTQVNVFGAKNEVVGFNVIIESPAMAQTGLSISFDQLTGPGGYVISGAPAASKEGVFNWTNRNIEIFKIRYLQIKGLSMKGFGGPDERQIPRRLQRPWTQWGIATAGTGWTDRPDHDKYYPDIAVPMEFQSTFGIAGNQNQSIWVDVYVPKTAPAGTYTGTFAVMKGSETVGSVPVTMTVRNFTLPDSPHSKTMVYMGYRDVSERYLGVPSPDNDLVNGPKLDKIINRHYQMAHRHKISLVDQDQSWIAWEQSTPKPNWLPRLNGQLFTAANGYAGPGTNVGNDIYLIGAYGLWWVNGVPDQASMNTAMDSYQNWFISNGLTNVEHPLFLLDEPTTTPAFDMMKQMLTQMRANPGVGKDIPGFAPMSLLLAQANGVDADIIGSTLGFGNTNAWQNALDSHHTAGHEFMLYNGTRPASGSFMTDDDGVALRELPWGQYKKNVDRWFYWESTYYHDRNFSGNETDIFTQAHTIGNDWAYDSVNGRSGPGYSNGDGVLFYPGTDTYFPDNSYDADGPIASLRLKYWRRGIQDVDYLEMARAINPGCVSNILTYMVPKVLWEVGEEASGGSVTTDIGWSVNPDKWEVTRKLLADVIEGGPCSLPMASEGI